MENKGLLAGLVAITVVALSALAFISLKSPSVIVTGGGSQGVAEQRYGGTTNLDSLGLGGTLSVTGAVTAGTLAVGSAGTVSDLMARTTLTVNPDSISAGSATTSAVTLTGAGTSDHCNVMAMSGDLSATSTPIVLACYVSASNTVTVNYRNGSGSPSDAGSSVLSIKVDSY